MSHASPRWRSLTVVPALVVLYGCGATVYLDKFDGAAAGQPPSPPAVGTSTTSGDAVVAAHPQVPGSTDRWLSGSTTNTASASFGETATRTT
jgi:hypothetical protein